VCVFERENVGGGEERERVFVCVNFLSFTGISTTVKYTYMYVSLIRRVLSQKRNPGPPSYAIQLLTDFCMDNAD
jgi:hypothetical protein